MAEETIYASVMATSAQLFGTALNPHSFRSLAATLLAETSPEDALHARPLLGHRQMETTEKHYIRASQLSAARELWRNLGDDGLRGRRIVAGVQPARTSRRSDTP